MRSRMIWILLAIVALVVIAAPLFMNYWLKSYLHGKDFLALISQLTGDALRTKTTYEPLKWSGSTAYSERAILEGRPGASIKRMEAREVRAEVNWRAAFRGAWRIEEINITQLDGEFVTPEKAVSEPDAPPPKVKGFTTFLPHRFELQQVRIARSNLVFGAITTSGVSLLIKPESSGIAIQGSGGKLTFPSGPALDIWNFHARYQGEKLFLTDSELRLGGSGKILASGNSGGESMLRIAWEGVNTEDVLPADWCRRFQGILTGSAEIKFPLSIRGKFLLRDGQVKDIPLLGSVADFTGNPSFRRMPLHEVSADFTSQEGVIKLSHVIAESKGLLRIEGTGEITPEGRLHGQFQMGVTPQTLQWLPGSRERVFNTARDGYLWTHLTIGGTLKNPTEDLSPRLAAAMGAEIIEQGSDLINAPVDGVESIMDFLRPLMR